MMNYGTHAGGSAWEKWSRDWLCALSVESSTCNYNMSSASSTPHRTLYSSLHPDEVIGYCESRLRAAFNVLERADAHKAEWIYDNMIRELVRIIS